MQPLWPAASAVSPRQPLRDLVQVRSPAASGRRRHREGFERTPPRDLASVACGRSATEGRPRSSRLKHAPSCRNYYGIGYDQATRSKLDPTGMKGIDVSRNFSRLSQTFPQMLCVAMRAVSGPLLAFASRPAQLSLVLGSFWTRFFVLSFFAFPAYSYFFFHFPFLDIFVFFIHFLFISSFCFIFIFLNSWNFFHICKYFYSNTLLNLWMFKFQNIFSIPWIKLWTVF